ncbi:MAG: polymer-forming cytoskeletal protein [Myxococcales bacterium FL481]|nr:MAG: polymer-forming cytoskeletal protein [Myxococcales bacterium FL481]
MATRNSMGTRAESSIGPGVEVKGHVEGDEDLHVEGRLEGSLVLSGALTVAADGLIAADVSARSVDVAGSIVGDVRAAETVVLHASAKLIGNIFSPRLTIAEGASFKGQIDMSGDVSTSRAVAASSSRGVSRTGTRQVGANKRDDRDITVVVKHAELSRGERPSPRGDSTDASGLAPKKRAKKAVRARVPARGKTKAKTSRRG